MDSQSARGESFAVEAAELLPGPAVALVTEPSDEPTHVPTISGIGGMFGAPDAPSATSAPEPSDQRDPEDLALDRKIKSICRGC